jgi:hypothetical protein
MKGRVVQADGYCPEVLSNRLRPFQRASRPTTGRFTSDLTLCLFLRQQNICDFGRREYQVEASKDLKTFGWDLKDTRLGVIDEIRQSYYTVLLAGQVKRCGQSWNGPSFFCASPFHEVGLQTQDRCHPGRLEVSKAQRACPGQNALFIKRVALNKALRLDEARLIN